MQAVRIVEIIVRCKYKESNSKNQKEAVGDQQSAISRGLWAVSHERLAFSDRCQLGAMGDELLKADC